MLFDTVVGFNRISATYVILPLYTCSVNTHQIQLQYIELNNYSTSFLCETIVNRSSFNVVSAFSSNAHAHEHVCSPNTGSKNQLNNYFYTC